MGRPIQPSVRLAVAEYLADADASIRCGFDAHQVVARGGVCPRCRMSLADYLAISPITWPEP